MRNLLQPFALIGCLGAFSAIASADTVLTMRVDVTAPPEGREPRVPAVGDYVFTFGKGAAHVTSPSGKSFIFNFDKQSFISLDPIHRSYYQMSIPDVLALGNRTPAAAMGNYTLKSSIKFTPESGPPGRSVLDRPVKPYQIYLEASVNLQTTSGGGFQGAYSPQSGVVFQGGSPVGKTRADGKGCRIQGELDLGNTPAGVDRDQMNTAIECLLLWCAPEMKELADRIAKSNLVILGGDYSVGTYVSGNSTFSRAPIVSIKAQSMGLGTLDPASLLVPSDYRSVAAPGPPWGLN